MAEKKYYWLKLRENFFQEEAIEWLEEQENGKEYVLFYLKLCLKSLKHNGILIRKVGDIFIPYDVSKLSEITRTNKDTVIVAMEILKKVGLIDVYQNGEIYMKCLSDLVGSESASREAVKKRDYRKKLKETSMVDVLSPKCPTECPTEYRDKSIEYRDKSIEYRDKSIDSANAPDNPSSKKVRHKHGEYQNVLLTDEDMQKLQAEFPADWQERIERLSEYMASKGASYKNHLATIRAWARKEVKEAKPQQKHDSYYDNKVLGVEI